MNKNKNTWAVDTSVAVAAVDESHEVHVVCREACQKRRPALAGHAAFETYSVLTRLPNHGWIDPKIVQTLLDSAFPERLWLNGNQQQGLLKRVSELGFTGGMVYDALVGEAARVTDSVLLTRDKRAERVYQTLIIKYEFVD
jgi:predicted nucleic acid-binding protein